MKKNILFLFLTLFVASSVWAQQKVKINGINYLYDAKSNTLSVTSNPNGYSGDIVIPQFCSFDYYSYDCIESSIVMGGAKSANGSFYTCDNGVQTTLQLGDNAQNVIFCFQTMDENHNTLENFRFISGTESPNAIVKSQTSETKFVMIGDASIDKYNKVVWSVGTTSIDISMKLESGRKAVAFKNDKCKGFFEVMSFDYEREDMELMVYIIVEGENISHAENAVVTSIEDGAFGEANITSITIPNNVTSIGQYAFYGCTNLTSVTIPESVTEIGRFTFYGCTSLTSITPPESVESIGENAFSGCTNLTSITIPSTVTKVGENAFSGCTKLTKVTCLSTTPPEVYSNSFENYNGYLYVPCESREAYDLDANWGNFKHVECIASETVELTKDEVKVEPEKTEAVFSMPVNESANSYTLTIQNNGVTFCTLTFNAQGQLSNIDFSTTKSYELKAGVSAYQFTVTGLSEATNYGYSFKALASNKSVLKEYAGSFTTKNADGTGGSTSGGGEGSLAVDNISANNAVTIANNQIFVNGEAPAFVVTISGKKIANQNLKSGVYFVNVEGDTVKVVK